MVAFIPRWSLHTAQGTNMEVMPHQYWIVHQDTALLFLNHQSYRDPHNAAIRSVGAIDCTVRHTSLLIFAAVSVTLTSAAAEIAMARYKIVPSLSSPYSMNYKLACTYPGCLSITILFDINRPTSTKYDECLNIHVNTTVKYYYI